MRTCPDNTCGFTTADDNERFCPDCGKELVVGGANPSTVATAPLAEPVVEEAPLPPPPDETIDTRPVLFTLAIPDKTEKQLREGDKLVIRRKHKDDEGPDDQADYYVPANLDGFVSASSPTIISVENGKMFVTGGGDNGYKITTVEPHAASDKTAIRKGQTLVLGAKTPFRVK